MTLDEQKVFQEKLFNDRFEIIDRSNTILLALLKESTDINKAEPVDFDLISKIATVRYHFYAELMDAADRQMIEAIKNQEQNAYTLNTKGGNA